MLLHHLLMDQMPCCSRRLVRKNQKPETVCPKAAVAAYIHTFCRWQTAVVVDMALRLRLSFLQVANAAVAAAEWQQRNGQGNGGAASSSEDAQQGPAPAT